MNQHLRLTKPLLLKLYFLAVYHCLSLSLGSICIVGGFFTWQKKTGWVFIYRQCCIPNANQHAYLAPIPKAAARMMSEIHIPEADGIVTVVLPVVDDTTPPL